MTVGRFSRVRRLISGSTGGNAAMLSLLQAVVANGEYDWIAQDPYGRAIVQVPNPLPVVYFRMGDVNQAAGLLDSWGNAIGSPQNGTYTPTGVTYGAQGPVGAGSNKAASFNGTSGSASAPVSLNAYSAITVEFWLNWTTFANNDALVMEFGAGNFKNTPGGFMIDPNGSFWPGLIEVSLNGSAGQSSWTIARPSAGVLHHYALVMAFGSPDSLTPYVDGVAVAATRQLSVSSAAQTFASTTLTLMSRNLTSLFGAGILDDVAIHGGPLSAAQVAGHYAQR